MLPSINEKMSAIPKRIISGLNHFDLPAYGLPFSLSTLNLCRYLHKPKTRSGIQWVLFSREDFHLRFQCTSWRTSLKFPLNCSVKVPFYKHTILHRINE